MTSGTFWYSAKYLDDSDGELVWLPNGVEQWFTSLEDTLMEAAQVAYDLSTYAFVFGEEIGSLVAIFDKHGDECAIPNAQDRAIIAGGLARAGLWKRGRK